MAKETIVSRSYEKIIETLMCMFWDFLIFNYETIKKLEIKLNRYIIFFTEYCVFENKMYILYALYYVFPSSIVVTIYYYLLYYV